MSWSIFAIIKASDLEFIIYLIIKVISYLHRIIVLKLNTKGRPTLYDNSGKQVFRLSLYSSIIQIHTTTWNNSSCTPKS